MLFKKRKVSARDEQIWATACAESMKGQERFRRQGQRDVGTGQVQGLRGRQGWLELDLLLKWPRSPQSCCVNTCVHSACRWWLDRAHGGLLRATDLGSVPVTAVLKVQYFCSYSTSRPFLFRKFQVHTCLHHRVITISPVSIHHHTVDPLHPLHPTPGAFLTVQENLLPHLGQFYFLKY